MYAIFALYKALAMTTLDQELTKREVLINSVMGLCGEALDIVKKSGYPL